MAKWFHNPQRNKSFSYVPLQLNTTTIEPRKVSFFSAGPSD